MTTTSSSPARPTTRPRRRWPWVLAGVLLLGAVGGGVYLVRGRATATATAAPATGTATASQGTVRVSVSGPGTLEANATRTVGADLTATVGAVPALGERVTRGQLLTTLESDTVDEDVGAAQLNLDKARASLDATRAAQASTAAGRSSSVTQAQSTLSQAQQSLESAARTLSGQRQLYAVGAVSAQALSDAQTTATQAQLSLDSARASLDSAQTQSRTGGTSDAETLRSGQIAAQQAQASLETAQKARADLKVYAPITGVISAVAATEGAVVISGATILTLLDDTALNLPVQVDETEIAGVKAGQQAEVTLDAYDGETFSGKVIRVSPGATQSNGISVFTATVQLVNPQGKLRSGMTAEAEIIQSQARGLIVPTRAIQRVRTRSYVQLPGVAGAEPQQVRVETGASDGTNTVVISGLEDGQEIVVPGTARSTQAQTTQTQGGFGPPPGGLP